MSRSLWSGSISFGLVTIPVRLFPATQDKDVHFHLMSPDGECRLRRNLVCPDTGEKYDFSETTRGYEIAPDQYVILEEEEIEQLKPESGHSIDIAAFVKLEEVDPIYFVTPYYLIPEEKALKPYALLTSVMKEMNQVAIAKFVMREKEYLCTLRPLGDDLLSLVTMRYHDEIRDPAKVIDKPISIKSPPKKELDLAITLVRSLSDSFDPASFRNDYRTKVKKLIEAKERGAPIPKARKGVKPSGKVLDLMDVLKKSVAAVEHSRASARKRKAKAA